MWLCAGISGMVSVCAASPPLVPGAYPRGLLAPSGNRPLRSGRLNVVLLSPMPYWVLIAANNAAYVVRDTACPAHARYPGGLVKPAFMMTVATGLVSVGVT